MRHELGITGHAFRLRPVGLDDAPLIVALRSDPERTRHLHPIELNAAAQQAYLRGYFDREGDYYFVIERLAERPQPAEGLVAIYDIDTDRRRGEWGRWVIGPQSLAAIESAWLIYKLGFDRLGLDEIHCYTLVDNHSVLSFHDKVGLVRLGRVEGLREIGGQRLDVIEHVLTRANWPNVSEYLESRARRLSDRLNGAP